MTLLILNTVYAHRHRNSAVWRSSPAVCINVSLFISYHTNNSPYLSVSIIIASDRSDLMLSNIKLLTVRSAIWM